MIEFNLILGILCMVNNYFELQASVSSHVRQWNTSMCEWSQVEGSHFDFKIIFEYCNDFGAPRRGPVRLA